MRLHADWPYLEQEFGCSLRDRFLMPVRSLDNPKSVAPFLLEAGNRRFGVFLHVEKGNVEAAYLPHDITPIYYRPYFTLGPQESPLVHKTLAEALCSVAASGHRLVLDRKLPIAVVEELSPAFETELEAGVDPGPVTLRPVAPADVLRRLARYRKPAQGAALRLIERSPARARIAPFLDADEDRRFAALDRLMGEAGLSVLVVSSTLNVQEIAGVPVRAKRRPLAAFYMPGGEAWILEAGRAPQGRGYPDAAAAFIDLCPRGRVGVESEDVDADLFNALGLTGRDTLPVDRTLRQWRDHNTLPDLAFYVIATRASAQAIDGSLDFARRAVSDGRPITEMDAFAVYMRMLRGAVADAMPQLHVARTLTNFHAGARTIFPANPAAFPLSKAANTLKVDAGCLLFDDEGVLLGCSDIARTLNFSDDGDRLYALLKNGVRNVLVPACAAGITGDAVHAAGVAALWNGSLSPTLNSLFVDLLGPACAYDRDVGHLLGKNNLAHLRLVRGEQQHLREGMIACCEYQWPLSGHAIAYEDTCLVTSTGGLNLTSDEE